MILELMFELAWKSALVAGVALTAASLLGARPAGERVAVLRLGVVMLLALPLLAAVMPALRVQAPVFDRPPVGTVATSPVREDAQPPTTAAPVARTEAASVARTEAASETAPAMRPEGRIDPVIAVLVVWAAGCAFLIIRLMAGLALLHHWTRRAEPVSDVRWLAALARAAQGRTPPVLRASPRVTSPLSWGWRPAFILLDPAALDQAGRADAVLTHEMGHVRHGDWLFLMTSRLLVALLWFNPLVWVLQRELARQSEEAADGWAAGRIGRAEYASALVALAARGRPQAALGMAAPRGDLAGRVIAIMNPASADGRPWRAALALAACVGLATPLAAIELSPAAAIASPGPRPETAPTPAPSPGLAAAVTRAMAPAAPRSADAPARPSELAAVLRQRNQGLAMMEAGALQMESQARLMRDMADGLGPDDRAAMNADADQLLRDAARLRADARDLAARDPATLTAMSPEEERGLSESLSRMIADGPPRMKVKDKAALAVPAPVTVGADVSVQTDSSGAYRASNGVEIDASGGFRTASGLRGETSGEIRAPNGARITAAGDIRAPDRDQRRLGALQMRDGARQMEAAALGADAATAADLRARAADLRRQADDMAPDG